jgi:Cu2+-exporting ATPase
MVHKLPKRRRYRLSLLGDPRVDLAHVEAYVEAIDGVSAARSHLRATSIAVEFDGSLTAEQAVTQYLSGLARHTVPHLARPASRPRIGLPQLISSALMLIVVPFLSRPLQTVLTLTAIAPRFFTGIQALLTPGSKVDALDAAAIGVAVARGDHKTANAVHFLLTLGWSIPRNASLTACSGNYSAPYRHRRGWTETARCSRSPAAIYGRVIGWSSGSES